MKKITASEVRRLRSENFPIEKIAEIAGCSESMVYKDLRKTSSVRFGVELPNIINEYVDLKSKSVFLSKSKYILGLIVKDRQEDKDLEKFKIQK